MGHPQFEKVVKIIEALRDPQSGCPWDIKQTHQSLTRYLIEEAYEFVQACNNRDPKEIEDELGDILLQVLLHATIGKQSGTFTLETVAQNLAEKMVRRHPHVFTNPNQNISEQEVKENWEAIKAKENSSHHLKSLNYLPALLAAHKIGEKTARVGFDWKNAQEVIPVVKEELAEFLDEVQTESSPSPQLVEEYGDLLFSMAQIGRHLSINSEEALHLANEKFIKRYNQMVDLIEQDNLQLKDMTQQDMDVYWKKVKQHETKK